MPVKPPLNQCRVEPVVDFCRNRHPPPTLVSIQETDIKKTDSYKYLSVHNNIRLDWSDNNTLLFRKGQSRLYLLRRIWAWRRHFFPDTVVASAIFFGVVCWASSISITDRKRLSLNLVQVVGAMLSSLLKNVSHPMHETPRALGSSISDRLLHPKCLMKCYSMPFFLLL